MDLHSEELLAFIGMNVAMGILRLPQIRDYWATNEILSTPWFPSIMSRDRFFQILRYLHLVDSSLQKKKGEDGYDPLYKVRPLLEHFSAVFPCFYQPEQQLLVDEMMVGTRCRISFLQYLPKKPTKFGIKIFINSEARTGYVLSFQVYTGKVASNEEGNKGVGHRVVMDLLDSFLGRKHWVFVDNFYSSPALFIDLLKNKTYATGTARTNRKGFPEMLTSQAKMDIGSYQFANKGDLLAVRWQDRREVFMLSTAHNTSVETVMKRPKGSREKEPLPCPSCICDYNLYMGGVDLADQYISYYSLTQRKTIKWWKNFFWRIIDICILNAWIIFRANFPESEINSHRLFRIELIHQMVQPLLTLRADPECPLRLSGSGKRPAAEKRLCGKHFANKSSKRARCAVCYNKKTPHGKRKDTKVSTFCPKCDVYLCIGGCFEKFHTQSKY